MFDAMQTRPLLPLTQSAAYARAMALLGVPVEELALLRPEGSAGHAMLQTRRLPVLGQVGLISRGPVWCARPDAALLARVIAGLRHPVILNADGMAREDLAAAGFFRIMTPATVAQLDLSGDAAARRGRMHQKWRNRLVRAEAGRLRVLRDAMPVDSGHWLLKAETVQRRARRYRELPIDFTLAFAQANPGKAQLFTARQGVETVAGMLFLQHGPTATYHIGHTTAAGRAADAHTLLLARAADWLADHGAEVLELGTIDTVNAPGLARFKLGSGAVAHPLGGTWLFSRRLARMVRLFGQTQVPAAASRIARMFRP